MSFRCPETGDSIGSVELISKTYVRRHNSYIHGYSDVEKQRFLAQKDHWKSLITLVDYLLESGLKLLDVGCAVGANLALFEKPAPGLFVAGLNREPLQIDAAGRNLRFVPDDHLNLRVGNGESLPLETGTFDRVFMTWLQEHVRNPAPILSEAHRVLRTGGGWVRGCKLRALNSGNIARFPSTGAPRRIRSHCTDTRTTCWTPWSLHFRPWRAWGTAGNSFAKVPHSCGDF